MSRAHWLALAFLSGIGSATARKLLTRFGDVASVFAASPEELEQVPRMTPVRAEQLLAMPIEALEAELLSLDDEGIDLLTWDDQRFPAHLGALQDAPLVLFMRGLLLSSDRLAVAIVGARAASPAGIEAARVLGRELAARADDRERASPGGGHLRPPGRAQIRRGSSPGRARVRAPFRPSSGER